MQRWRVVRSKEGFSLVELLVVIVIVLLFLASLYEAFNRIYSSYKEELSETESMLSETIGIYMLKRDLWEYLNDDKIFVYSNYTKTCEGVPDIARIDFNSTSYLEVSSDGESDNLTIKKTLNKFIFLGKWAVFNLSSSGDIEWQSGVDVNNQTISDGGYISYDNETKFILLNIKPNTKKRLKSYLICDDDGRYKFLTWAQVKEALSSEFLIKGEAATYMLISYHFLEKLGSNKPEVNYYLEMGDKPRRCAPCTFALLRRERRKDGWSQYPVLDCVLLFRVYYYDDVEKKWKRIRGALGDKWDKLKVDIIYQVGRKRKGTVTNYSLIDMPDGNVNLSNLCPNYQYYKWDLLELRAIRVRDE